MKKTLALLLTVLMLFALAPNIAGAEATGAGYDKTDIVTALSGLGRFTGSNYALLKTAILLDDDVSSAKAELATERLYRFWALASEYAYTTRNNVMLGDLIDRESWLRVSGEIYDNIVQYQTPENTQRILETLAKITTQQLRRVAAPNGLLGIHFSPAKMGEEVVARVYVADTTHVSPLDLVKITDASGNTISAAVSSRAIPSKTTKVKADVVEYTVTLSPFAVAGTYSVRVYIAQDGQKNCYVNAALSVAPAKPADGASAKTKATVKKVSASKASFGSPTAITVQTSVQAEFVKVTDSDGETLAFADTPVSTTRSANNYLMNYAFPQPGKNAVVVYAGITDPTDPAKILWNTAAKKATITVNAVAAKVSKAVAKAVVRGTPSVISVTTNASATRVKVEDADGNVLDYSDVVTGGTAKAKVFTLSHTLETSGSVRVNVYAGDGSGWSTVKKTVTLKATDPKVLSIRATRGKNKAVAALTIVTDPTVTRVRVYSPRTVLIAEAEVTNGVCVLDDPALFAGRNIKTLYAQVFDRIGPASVKAFRLR